MQNFRTFLAAFDLICINSHKITTSLLVPSRENFQATYSVDDVYSLFPVTLARVDFL